MAKIGFSITTDRYNIPAKTPGAYLWAEDKEKHPYELTGFRFVVKNDVIFVGNLYDDKYKKSHEMALHWCCFQIRGDPKINDDDTHFDLSINGQWKRQF